MSFWFSTPDMEIPTSVASGEAPLSAVYNSARDQQRLVENNTAANEALTRAYDARIKAIEAATGERLANPMRVATTQADATYTGLTAGSSMFMRDTAPDFWSQNIAAFNKQLADVAKRHPANAAIIGADQPVEKDALALARNADETSARAMASRDGIGKWLAAFAGGFAGSLSDPMQVATFIIGGGTGGAKTIAGRILATTLSEAAANAAMEAVQQPQVQAWRKEAGLPNGFSEALSNTVFAGLIGGAFGGGAHALGEGLRALHGLRDAAGAEPIARAMADRPDTSPVLKQALAGDSAKAAEILAPVRDFLPPEARGAVDAATTEHVFTAAAPPTVSPAIHETNLNRALASTIRHQPFTPEVDPAQVARIADQLQPETAAARADGQTLSQFLIRQGGVQDFKGEIAALGLANASEKFSGRLVKEGGMPLDNARLAAAQAGYFNHLYGTADNAAEKSTVRDLLDALDNSTRAPDPAPANARAHVEGLVHDLIVHAGPGIDDRTVARAAKLANAEGLSPQDAMDRVLIANDKAAEAIRAQDPNKPGVYDTRGQGTRFHGSKRGLDPTTLDNYTFSDLNYYGQGFYTTDAVAIAHGYAKAKINDIFTINEKTPVKALNMEQPIPRWLIEDSDEFIYSAIEEHHPKNVRELYDAIRETGTADGMPAYEIQEYFDSLRYRMEANGYNAMDHTGGLKTKNQPHSVRIYFSPGDDLYLSNIQPEDYFFNTEPAAKLAAPNEQMRGGLDNPGAPIEDTFFSESDLADLPDGEKIPFFEDRSVTGEELKAELQRLDDLVMLVEACKA
jgi:hypothetical protein